jgi:GH15 family glucan-1,4-alpha-glucosidase
MNSQKKFDLSSFIKGMIVGAVSLIVYQYTRAIVTQPRLTSRAMLSNAADFDTVETHALFIATENLRSAIEFRRLRNKKTRQILHAGYRNFRESWARDFGFAVFGLLALKEYKAVKDTMEAFLDHQKMDGQLPVKLHAMGAPTRFMYSLLEREQPTEIPLRPKYLSAHGAPSLDGQALLVIATIHYSREANDLEFIRTHWDALVKAILWMEQSAKDSNGELLIQGPFADWADSIDRRGRALYTNVLYWKALQEMSEGATRLGFAESASTYIQSAEQVADAIQKILWRPSLGYFAASDVLNHLTSSGNLLAIAWGLSSTEQTNSILEALINADMANPVPTKVAFPSYPRHLIALENRLAGIANYHTDAAWLWIGAWHVIALARAGRLDESRATCARMAGVIVRDRQIHEVYAPNGKPLSNFWYKSESPLTWNAGMIVYAYSVLDQLMKSKTDVVPLVNEKD